LVFGYLAQYENWGAPFIVSAVLLVAGAAVWGLLARSRPVGRGA